MATTTVQRSGTAGMVGGALWALLPVVFLVHLEDTARGTLAFFAVATALWVVGALSLVLLLVAVSGLRAGLADGGGRVGAIGIVVSGVALLAMVLGNGTELTTLTVSGTESDLGHSVFLIGFLVLVAGSLLLGIALLRGRREPLVRWAGALMVGMVPLGFGLGVPAERRRPADRPRVLGRDHRSLRRRVGPARPIARTLFLSPKTVANYVSAIFAKLQVADRAEAMIRAREAGLGS